MSAKDINQAPTDAAEDDDFGDFEGPEDDAPECVQGLGGPPTWVFPDLLRVQTNQTPHEEPESVANSGLSSGHSRPHALPRNDMRGATGRETGAIPKQRALDPPDVSLLTNSSQPKMPSTLDLCSTAFSSNSYSRENSQPSTSSVLRPTHLMKDMGSSHNGSPDSNNDSIRIRINQLESDLKQIQTQKQLLQQQLLQKDTQIRELQSQSRQSTLNLIPQQQPQDSIVASLVDSVDKFRSNIELAMSRLEQRLTSLETRVSETNLLSIGCDSSATNNSTDQNGCHNLSQTLSNILAQQKKEVENEKRQNLLLFSSILKNALETVENHLDANRHNCDQNK